MTLSRLVRGLFIAVIGVTAVVLYFLYSFFWSQVPDQGAGERPFATREAFTDEDRYLEMLEGIHEEELLSGSILITTRPKEFNQGLQGINNYKYDVFSNNITPLDLGPNPGRGLFPFYSPVINRYVLTTWPLDTTLSALLINDVATNEFSQIKGSTQIAGSASLRLPRVSPDGQSYLFTAQTWENGEGPTDYLDINSYDIYVGSLINPDEPSKLFANGYGAQFVLGGSYIVYVKSDGVYAKKHIVDETQTENEEIPITFEYLPHSLRNQIGVSPDGQYIAVAYPIIPDQGDSSIDIYKLNFDGSELATPGALFVHRITLENNAIPFWPIFSPGGRYISFQRSEQTSANTFDNSLVIYDLVEKKLVRTFDFNAFDFQMSFNTDWVVD